MQEKEVFRTKTMPYTFSFKDDLGLSDEEARDKAIDILDAYGFCDDLIYQVEWDEFTYGVLMHPDTVEKWGREYDLSDSGTATDLVVFLTTD